MSEETQLPARRRRGRPGTTTDSAGGVDESAGLFRTHQPSVSSSTGVVECFDAPGGSSSASKAALVHDVQHETLASSVATPSKREDVTCLDSDVEVLSDADDGGEPPKSAHRVDDASPSTAAAASSTKRARPQAGGTDDSLLSGTLTNETLKDISRFRSDAVLPGHTGTEKDARITNMFRQPNDYVVPNVMQLMAGTMSQFERNNGLAPVASDSCETFATVFAVLVASLVRHERSRLVFHPSAINYFLYLSSWLHLLSTPLWSRNGTQRRPTVNDVAQSLNLAEAFPSMRVAPERFIALPYRNRDMADGLIARLLLPWDHPDLVRSYIVVTGDYTISVAALHWRTFGRLVSSTLIIADSHGDLPWARRSASLSTVRFQSAQYPKHRPHLESKPGSDELFRVVDDLPSYEEGVNHFKRILFTFMEHCRRENTKNPAATMASRKYSTWVPVIAVEVPADMDPAAAKALRSKQFAGEAGRAVFSNLHHASAMLVLRNNEACRNAFTPVASKSPRRFFICSSRSTGERIDAVPVDMDEDDLIPVAPRPLWLDGEDDAVDTKPAVGDDGNIAPPPPPAPVTKALAKSALAATVVPASPKPVAPEVVEVVEDTAVTKRCGPVRPTDNPFKVKGTPRILPSRKLGSEEAAAARKAFEEAEAAKKPPAVNLTSVKSAPPPAASKAAAKVKIAPAKAPAAASSKSTKVAPKSAQPKAAKAQSKSAAPAKAVRKVAAKGTQGPVRTQSQPRLSFATRSASGSLARVESERKPPRDGASLATPPRSSPSQRPSDSLTAPTASSLGAVAPAVAPDLGGMSSGALPPPSATPMAPAKLPQRMPLADMIAATPPRRTSHGGASTSSRPSAGAGGGGQSASRQLRLEDMLKK